MIFCRVFFLLPFFLFLGGCAFFNFLSDKKPTSNKLEKFEEKIILQKKWQINVEKNTVLNSGVGAFGPQIFDNTVVTSFGSGSVIAFDLENGMKFGTLNLIREYLLVGFSEMRKVT